MNNTQPSGTTVQTPTAKGRSTEFVPVEGGGETTDAATYMVAAYVLMWLCTVAFVVMTWRKMQRVQSQVTSLQKALADKA